MSRRQCAMWRRTTFLIWARGWRKASWCYWSIKQSLIVTSDEFAVAEILGLFFFFFFPVSGRCGILWSPLGSNLLLFRLPVGALCLVSLNLPPNKQLAANEAVIVKRSVKEREWIFLHSLLATLLSALWFEGQWLFTSPAIMYLTSALASHVARYFHFTLFFERIHNFHGVCCLNDSRATHLLITRRSEWPLYSRLVARCRTSARHTCYLFVHLLFVDPFLRSDPLHYAIPLHPALSACLHSLILYYQSVDTSLSSVASS